MSYIQKASLSHAIEEHKLFFNPHIIVFMFMGESQLQYTWDVCFSVEPTTCDVN